MGGTNLMVAAREYIENKADGYPEAAALGAFVEQFVPLQAGAEITVVAKDYAIASWQQEGVDTVDITGTAKSADTAGVIQRLIADIAPAVVLTATTDVDDRTDITLWRACREANIAVAALVDHRVNINARFFDGENKQFYPDMIFVIDEEVRQQLLDSDVHPDKVKVIGDLHLARLRRKQATESSCAQAAELREKWGAGDEDIAILFVSECLREMRRLGAQPTINDEIHSLDDLLHHLLRKASLGDWDLDLDKVQVVVRPHPKDDPGKYAGYNQPKGLTQGEIRICVDASTSAEIAILASDIVTGMDSTMLGEAMALGKPVFSNCMRDKSGALQLVEWYRK